MNKLIVAVTLLSACFTIPAGADDKDKELSKKIVGKWQVRYVDTDRKRASIAWTVYASNGMASSRTITQVGDKQINLTLEAKWSITDGVLSTMVTKTSDKRIVKVGDKTQDKIQSITEKELKYVDADGNEVTEKRVPDDPKPKDQSATKSKQG